MKNSSERKNGPFRYRNLFLVALFLGVAHWIYLTWDNPWRVPRYGLLTKKVVRFEWDRDHGFTKFDVKAYPGDWFVERLLRGLLSVKLRPRVAVYLKPSKWKEAEGDTVFTMVSFCPLVLSDSLGTDASEVRDPTKTPLMHAAESGDIELTRNLINSGADVNATDQNGKTALFYALKSSGEAAREVTQLLLAAGAKANVADRDGYTLLMRAATNGEIGVVRLLLKAGANPNIKNPVGDTAVSLANREGHPDVAALINDPSGRPKAF